MHDRSVLKGKLLTLREPLAHADGMRIAPDLHEMLVIMRGPASCEKKLYDGLAYCHGNHLRCLQPKFTAIEKE